jgi:GNAT superfamily N-acetyltransferase
MTRMQIRPATVDDAADVAALVRASESAVIDDPAGAAPFWEVMSASAHAGYLASSRYRYWVAESQGVMQGYIAMRDVSHLFNLFVAPAHQRTGVGRALWQHALAQTPAPAKALGITVNASLNAVPAYRALGFAPVGEVVRQHGLAFVPMRWTAPGAA